MSETAERLWNALHGGETVSNDKVKQDSKWRTVVCPTCRHDTTTNVPEVLEATIASALATVRREVWDAAIEIAKAELVPEPCGELDENFNAATQDVIRKLEQASANSEKQVNEDDHRCYNKGGAL